MYSRARLVSQKKVFYYASRNFSSEGEINVAGKASSGSCLKVQNMAEKLRVKTPIGKLDELEEHPHLEKEPLKPWPNNKNPFTGEIGGPKGPEPTRYGDWERKGRVSDF